LTQLRRTPPRMIYKQLRSIRCDILWIVVSNHGYQPFLSILLLMGSLTRARRIRVTDFLGEYYSVTRFHIIACEPFRMLLGSLLGLAAVGRAHMRCRI